MTGGRLDESGESRILLMDVWRLRRGGLFQARGGQRGDFVSLPDPGTLLRFTADGDQLLWQDAAGAEQAVRIHAPRQVEVRIAAEDATLAGTLHLPEVRSATRIPGLVLAHGSGRQNRHAGPWTTFFVDQGFAVLTYDKRGVGASGGDYASADFEALGGDLAAAVAWLVRHPEVDGAPVGIHASSQSGWYAPRAAARGPASFLIVRAGPPLPTGATTLHERMREWQDQDLSPAEIEPAIALWRALMAAAAAGEPLETAQGLIDQVAGQPWFALAYGESWTSIRGPWWQRERVNARFDPVADLARHHLPALWFLADADENVPYAPSMAALREAMASNPRLESVTVEDATHDFLVRDPAGGVRYTDRYWPAMAHWLASNGFARQPTAAASCLARPGDG